MKELPAILLESFRRGGRVNAAMMDAITDADLNPDDGQGGWNVGQHIGHIAEFRYGWLTRISPPHAEELFDLLDGTEEKFWLISRDLGRIREAFDQGDAAALEAVQSAYVKGRNFTVAYTSDPAHFLQHIIVHDSHHWGQIITLLRRNGWTKERLEELEEATWPVWRA